MAGNDLVDTWFKTLWDEKHYKKIRALACKAMDLIDALPGVWTDGAGYAPNKKHLRDLSRHLLAVHNSAVHAAGSQDYLYSTSDRGEWDAKKPCEVCGKKPSLPDAETFAARWLCLDCTRIPFKNLPPRGTPAQPSFFQVASSFTPLFNDGQPEHVRRNEQRLVKKPKPRPGGFRSPETKKANKAKKHRK